MVIELEYASNDKSGTSNEEEKGRTRTSSLDIPLSSFTLPLSHYSVKGKGKRF
jgi:hypothetical protein